MSNTNDLFKNMDDTQRRLMSYALEMDPSLLETLETQTGHQTSQTKQLKVVEMQNRHRFYDDIISALEAQYEEISGYDFYKTIFPDNENSGEQHNDYSHPNAIYLYRDPQYPRTTDPHETPWMFRRAMLDDTWEEDYMEYIEKAPGCLCGGLAYRTNINQLSNAQRMYAMIFDLDGVGISELRNLFIRFDLPSDHMSGRSIPRPTYINCSGNGLHLVYQFDLPIDLYPNIKTQLKSLKHDLTFRIWDYKGTTTVKRIQYQSINQGYRMVGSLNEKHDVCVRSFKVGEPINIAFLNKYVPEQSRVDVNKPFKPTQYTRLEAAEKFPEWYERVVVKGNKNPKKWDIAGKVHGDDPYALYHWWKNKLPYAKGGHRYFFMMCMAIYACKCDVSKEQLEKDMWEVYEVLKTVEHDNPMKPYDVESALEAYDKAYYNYTIDDISKLSDILIQKNARNGRKQDVHMKRISTLRDMDYPDGSWRNKDGAPTKKDIVLEWRKNNPEGSKSDCIKATGLSKPTVYKWWDSIS